MRSNGMSIVKDQFPTAIEQADVSKIGELVHKYPQEVRQYLVMNPNMFPMASKSNLLTKTEESHQPPSDIEILTRRLRKNYVRLSTDHGLVYGLMFKGNRGISVSHLIADEKTRLTAESDGKIYTARVTMMNRSRDLMAFEITDKTFPPVPDITSLFPTGAEFQNLRSGWYIRPTTEPIAIQAPLTFIDTFRDVLTDKSNPFFRCTGSSWKASLIGLSTVKKVIS